ncbi:hypothetical protein [Paraburkholderia sp. J10-1]|uniref:hypothetical protein n=1 Tax=Paraburkholderia sp. J10-1 TaxID=2805430 RepID=UPI002AB77B06|nr:hypothetical protein [Paraburkholderia sp. J10-1]
MRLTGSRVRRVKKHGQVSYYVPELAEFMRQRRELPGFRRRIPELAAVWWTSPVMGKHARLSPALAHALECAWLAGGLETLGAAMGWPGDDVRQRALSLQREAADRLAALRDEEKKHWVGHTAISVANAEINQRGRLGGFRLPPASSIKRKPRNPD